MTFSLDQADAGAVFLSRPCVHRTECQLLPTCTVTWVSYVMVRNQPVVKKPGVFHDISVQWEYVDGLWFMKHLLCFRQAKHLSFTDMMWIKSWAQSQCPIEGSIMYDALIPLQSRICQVKEKLSCQDLLRKLDTTFKKVGFFLSLHLIFDKSTHLVSKSS